MAGSHQIWEMNLEKGTIQTFAGSGAEGCFDSTLNDSAFAQPSGITTNGEELFIADSEVSSIRGVELGEKGQVRTVCGSGMLFGFGDIDGQKLDVRLQHCLGVEYFQNKLWVADTYNHKIKLVDPVSGYCQTVLGDGLPGFQDGQGKNTKFSEPSGLSALGSVIYISDTNNHAIRCVDINTLQVKTLDLSGLCSLNTCLFADISAL
jgi:hypothetical protein